MGFWDDVGDFFSSVSDAVAEGAEAVGDAVETVVNGVGEVVGDIVETTGNVIQDGFNAAGGVLSGIPIIGESLKGVCAWIGGIVAGVTNFITANWIKGPTALIGGVVGGLIKVIGGVITLHGDLIVDGLIDIAAGFVGALIAVFGTLVSIIQRLVPVINNDRALTKKEKKLLAIVFQGSISYYNIRIKYTSGAPTTHFTLGNTIYSPNQDLLVPLATLVHECVHVWQYQNLGYRYLVDALGAQLIYGRDASSPGNAYDWTAEIARGRIEWEDFNKESQAEFIEDIWEEGSLRRSNIKTTEETVETGNGAFYKKQECEENPDFRCAEEFIASLDGLDHTTLAIETVEKLRALWNFRLSQFI